jgi:hypothetical protein
MVRVFGAAAVVAVVTIGPARAGNWAHDLFSESGHDFGPVPRGAKVRHPFVVTNRLAEPITILNVRASCGCTTGRTAASTVAPGQSAVIEAEMDTRNFVGKKATTLFVTLVSASGREAEVRLAVSSTILSDVVLNPGTIDFGAVARGQAVTKTLTIDRSGPGDWEVTRMVSACKSIDAKLVEMKRQGGTVSYQLEVSLKPDAPAGPIRDEIRILTNDPESPVVPVLVTGLIRGDLSASPGLLALGRVQSSSGVQGRIVIRGGKPFAITAIEGVEAGFKAEPDDSSRKPAHLLAVSFDPASSPMRGDLHRVLRIVTDLPGEPPLEVPVTLHVDP